MTNCLKIFTLSMTSSPPVINVKEHSIERLSLESLPPPGVASSSPSTTLHSRSRGDSVEISNTGFSPCQWVSIQGFLKNFLEIIKWFHVFFKLFCLSTNWEILAHFIKFRQTTCKHVTSWNIFVQIFFWRNLCIEVCGSEWAAVGAGDSVVSDTRVSVGLRYYDW